MGTYRLTRLDFSTAEPYWPSVSRVETPQLLADVVDVPPVMAAGGREFRRDQSGADVPLHGPERQAQRAGEFRGGDPLLARHDDTLSRIYAGRAVYGTDWHSLS